MLSGKACFLINFASFFKKSPAAHFLEIIRIISNEITRNIATFATTKGKTLKMRNSPIVALHSLTRAPKGGMFATLTTKKSRGPPIQLPDCDYIVIIPFSQVPDF